MSWVGLSLNNTAAAHYSNLAELHTDDDLRAEAPQGGVLQLNQIMRVPTLFQARHYQDRDGIRDEGHVAELLRVLKGGDDLEPVTVWRCGGEWVLIDGHHRAAAYRHLKRSIMPVKPFLGSLNEAIAEAGAANSRAKLPMSLQERQDFAWRLIGHLGDPYSQAETKRITGSGTSSIKTMRRVVRAMRTDGVEPGGFDSWWQASTWNEQREGKVPEDEDEDAMVNAKAEVMSARLGKALGDSMKADVRVTARALAAHLGRLAPDVLRELGEHLDIYVDPDANEVADEFIDERIDRENSDF